MYNKYDVQTKKYPTIWTHYKLHNDFGKKSRFSRNVYAMSDRICCNKHLRHTTSENMTTMGKFDTSDLMMIMFYL